MAKMNIPGVFTSNPETIQKEEPVLKKPEAKFVANTIKPRIPKKTLHFTLARKDPNPAMAGQHYPLTFSVPYEDVIYDSDRDQNRKIRYCPGETSIYADEQSEEAKVSTIIFSRGHLIVRPNEPLLRDYLLATNFFGENPDRDPSKVVLFRLQDNARDSKKELELAENRHYAEGLALKMEGPKAITLARVLGIDINRSMYEIRHDLKVMAASDSDNFIARSESPKLERMNIIMEAKEYGIISMSKRSINWAVGRKEVITTVPIGMDPLEFFTDFTYETEGVEVYNTIKKRHEVAVNN